MFKQQKGGKMDFSFLSTTKLFRGISTEDIKAMLVCLDFKADKYEKGQIIHRTGETIDSIGMVVSGGVNIEHNDYWGNRAIISHVSPGQIFGETYACLTGQPLLVDAVASEQTEVLAMNVGRVIRSCSNSCEHHAVLIRNLLTISSHKNLLLSQRMFHTSFKSMRAKLMSYFSEQAQQAGSSCFTVPFNRQQLADYLNVDRSAMCNEISKMKKDGVILVEKNTFTMLAV